MPTLLLPELAREMARSNRRVAEFLEAEWRRLQKLHADFQEANTLKRTATRSASGATTATLSRKADIAGVWQRAAAEILKDGLGGEPAKQLLQEVRDIIDSWLRLAQHSRDLAKLALALGGAPEGLDELDAAEQDAKRAQAAVEQMEAFLGGTRPPLDATRLQNGVADIAQGRFKNPDELRSRLGDTSA